MKHRSVLTPSQLFGHARTFACLVERLNSIASTAQKHKTRVDKVRVEDLNGPEGFGETLKEILNVFTSVSEDFIDDLDWTVYCTG